MIEYLKKLERKILPPSEENRVAPYIWLVYLFIFYFSLAFGQHGWFDYLSAVVGTVIFLYYYFNAYWQCGLKVSKNIVALVVLGSYFSTITPGSSVFFVYAGAFCCHLGSPKKALVGLVLIGAWVAFFSWYMQMNNYFYVPALLFTFMIGGVNIYQAEIEKKRKELILSREELKALATTAERERIARDLHDLIGHTFAVITLKAELAGKLIDKNSTKAKGEIKQLENISRDALKQVREVVTGYRSTDLVSEFAHAKYVLESNDIFFEYELVDAPLNEILNKELAIILKELVTNVLKHANASKVVASLRQKDNTLVLQVVDDGIGLGKRGSDGFGFQGIGERIEKFDGSITIEEDKGAKIEVIIPLKDSE